MFNPKVDRPDGREAVTLIGEEAYFHGVLAVKGSLRVEGVVEGDVNDAVSVEIGKKGRIKGNITAETVSIAGAVEGEIVASRSVDILAGARLLGNLRTPRLRVEDGGILDGQCSMNSTSEEGARPREALQETQS